MLQPRIAELLVKYGFKIRSCHYGVGLDESITAVKIAEALDKAERATSGSPWVETNCKKCGVDYAMANFVCPDMQCPHRAQLLCEGGDAGVSPVSG